MARVGAVDRTKLLSAGRHAQGALLDFTTITRQHSKDPATRRRGPPGARVPSRAHRTPAAVFGLLLVSGAICVDPEGQREGLATSPVRRPGKDEDEDEAGLLRRVFLCARAQERARSRRGLRVLVRRHSLRGARRSPGIAESRRCGVPLRLELGPAWSPGPTAASTRRPRLLRRLIPAGSCVLPLPRSLGGDLPGQYSASTTSARRPRGRATTSDDGHRSPQRRQHAAVCPRRSRPPRECRSQPAPACMMGPGGKAIERPANSFRSAGQPVRAHHGAAKLGHSAGTRTSVRQRGSRAQNCFAAGWVHPLRTRRLTAAG